MTKELCPCFRRLERSTESLNAGSPSVFRSYTCSVFRHAINSLSALLITRPNFEPGRAVAETRSAIIAGINISLVAVKEVFVPVLIFLAPSFEVVPNLIRELWVYRNILLYCQYYYL